MKERQILLKRAKAADALLEEVVEKMRDCSLGGGYNISRESREQMRDMILSRLLFRIDVHLKELKSETSSTG